MTQKRRIENLKAQVVGKPAEIMTQTHTLDSIKRLPGIAGQIAYEATVTYEGEEPSTVTFIGSVYGGPVVMVTESGAQTFVTDPGRFGGFGEEWVRRFFA